MFAGAAAVSVVGLVWGAVRGKKTEPKERPWVVDDPDGTEFDQELALLQSSLPKKDWIDFTIHHDSFGSLLSCCPSHQQSDRICQLMLTAIVARNVLQGLSRKCDVNVAVAGIRWAEQELLRVIEETATTAEWLIAGRNATRGYFGILRSTQPQRAQA